MEIERKGIILGQPCDLDHIPKKKIRIVEYNSDETLPHGCVVALPNQDHTNDEEILPNPIPLFSSLLQQLSDANLTFGTFVFASNSQQLKTYSSTITANTLFYYMRFEHRTDCMNFLACAKQCFNICLYSKKLSTKHIHHFRKYEDNEYNTHDENLDDEIEDIEHKNDNNIEENEYDYEEEDKEEEKKEEATPPPGTSYTPTRKNIMETLIDSPHGRLQMKQLLQMKFIEYNTCHVTSVPIVYSYPNILCSKSWFGKFGIIIDIKIYNGEHSQCKCVQIKYDNQISAKNALSYCDSNYFSNEKVKLSARLGIQKYCPFFLTPNATCTTTDCPDIHAWKSKHKNDYNNNNKSKNNKEMKNDNLRSKMRKIAQNYPIISLVELPNVFTEYFKQNIHQLYPGNLKEMIKYFHDIFDLKYNRNKTKCYIMSKIHNQANNNQENDDADNCNMYERNDNKQNDNKQNCLPNRYQYNENNEHKQNYTKQNYTEQNYNIQNRNNNSNAENWDNYNAQNNEQNDHKENHIENNNEENDNEDNDENEDNYTQENCSDETENKTDNNEENVNEYNENVLDGNIICKNKFKFWLCNICKLEQYLGKFEECNYNDITMVEFVDEDILKNDLCISSVLHMRLLLKRVNEFKIMMNEFDEILTQLSKLKLYKQSLTQYGILTINHLRNDVKTIKDVKRIFNVNNKKKAHALLETINDIV